MARRSWSYLFFVTAVLNVLLAVIPSNPIRFLNATIVPLCLLCGVLVRRTMIGRVRRGWYWDERDSQTARE